MQGKKDYQEKLFIRFQLSDYVPVDNFYRQLKGILDLTFLYGETSQYYGAEGQKSIDPVVFFKLMLVGYLENLTSDRRIISSARMRMDILYFLGYGPDEELPCHSTLCRTRRLFGEDLFNKIFKLVLKQCIDKGMLSGKRQAIDSALIKANASMSSLVEKEVLEDAAAYASELEANTDQESIRSIVPEPVTSKEKVSKSQIVKSNKTHYSPADEDARISLKPGKPCRLNYLAQTCVDTSSLVITSMQAFHADKKDTNCFNEIFQSSVANLKDNGLHIEEILADGGYSSLEVLQTLKDYNITGYISNRIKVSPANTGFVFDRENDRYICPNGAFLTYRRTKVHSENSKTRLYQSSVKDCKNCPFNKSCANSRNYRVIEGMGDRELVIQMEERMRTRRGKIMKSIRSSSVEPVLGTLINYTGLRQINTKGIKQANKCMLMAATAYNLKKLLKFNQIQKIKSINISAIGPVHKNNMPKKFVNGYFLNQINRFFRQILEKLQPICFGLQFS